MEKVKLPRKVAEAIQWMREHQEYTNYDILQRLIDGELKSTHAHCVREFAVGYEGGFDIILQALVNGYEVEQTPEDKVREIYQQGIRFHKEWHNPAVKVAVEDVLDALGIKIEGVNA